MRDKTYFTRGYEVVQATGDAIDDRTADISWTSETDNNGKSKLTFETPTPEGSPAMYYIVEKRSDPLTGVVYDTSQYQVLITVKSVNGKLVPSYQVKRGSDVKYDTSWDPGDLNHQVSFTNQYVPDAVLSSPTDGEVITYNGMGYKVTGSGSTRSVSVGGTSYTVYAKSVKVGDVEYPVVNGQVTIGDTTYTVENNKI